MAKRLMFVVALVASTMACKGSKKSDEQGRTPAGTEASATTELGRDAIERALMGLGIEGRPLRIDLNQDRKGAAVRFAQEHLTADMLILETNDAKPRLYGLTRTGLNARWASDLLEPTATRIVDHEVVPSSSVFKPWFSRKEGGRGSKATLQDLPEVVPAEPPSRSPPAHLF